MCPREITVRHRRGWLLVLRESIICANAGPRSRHPQWQSSPCLLAMSPGAHALARRARSHCSFSTILHVADSSAEERHFGAQAACSSHAGDAAACFSPHSHRCPHSVACFLRVLASQVFMLCKCDSRVHRFSKNTSQPSLLRRARSSRRAWEYFSTCTLCLRVSSVVWPSCVLISSSVCRRRAVMRVCAAELELCRLHVVPSCCAQRTPFLQAQRSNTRHPLGDPLSASLRVVSGRGDGVLIAPGHANITNTTNAPPA